MKKLFMTLSILLSLAATSFAVDFYPTTLNNGDYATIAAFENVDDLEKNIGYSLVFLTSIYTGNPKTLLRALEDNHWEILGSLYWDAGYQFSLTVSDNVCRLIKYENNITYRKEIELY